MFKAARVHTRDFIKSIELTPHNAVEMPPCENPIVIEGAACQCGEGYYLCNGNTKCIPGFLMCDGETDCPENDDEVNCRKLLYELPST